VNLADPSQSRRQGLIQTNSAQLLIRHEHVMAFVIDAIEKMESVRIAIVPPGPNSHLLQVCDQ
jgi:hypothetical protein